MEQGELIRKCIDACKVCEDACRECAFACLQEKDVAALRTCIQNDLECARICATTVDLLIMDSQFRSEIVALCMASCEVCQLECEKHAEHMEHCRRCAEACEICLEACRQLAA
ncbi:MAG: four-helix bundle copper-binding protein [Sphingobacterium sp.]